MSTDTIRENAHETRTAHHLDELAAELTGELARPGEPGYEIGTPWNVAVPSTPLAVVRAADGADVAATVRFAGEHGLKVAVRRTGHGATELDGDVLLVHTGRLDGLEIDARTRTARIGAGVVWQQVLDAAAAHGLAPLCGSAPGVGVVGFLTGGGISPLVRTYGLASDRVRAFDVVTGDGTLRRATPTQNAELFWGLRGGKATLGIVTAVEIDLLELTGFHGGAMFFAGEDAAAVLHAWRSWTQTLPEWANTSVALVQLPATPDVPPPLAGKLTVAVRYAAIADPAEAEALLEPIRAVAPRLIDTIAPMPSPAIGAVHLDPVDPMPTHEAGALLNGLTPEAVDALLAVAGPGSGSPQVIVEVRHLGGALARPAEHADAFSHRDAAYNLLVIGVLAPPIAEVVPVHAEAAVRALEPWATGGILPNFSPSADAAQNARAYDQDTWHWLCALADQHDPKGVFRVGQVARRPE